MIKHNGTSYKLAPAGDAWINYVANNLKNTSNSALGFKIEELMLTNPSVISKYVSAVDKTVGEINFLKLGNY